MLKYKVVSPVCHYKTNSLVPLSVYVFTQDKILFPYVVFVSLLPADWKTPLREHIYTAVLLVP